VALLETFCAANGWTCEVMQDLGSGLNDNKQGLQKLIRRVCDGSAGRLVLANKDRLLRFGSELVFQLCKLFNLEVVLLNQREQPLRCEEELAQDILEIITVFSARLYGSRSQKNRKLVERWRAAAEAL
jgi:predicted site-specific integrase-resolvase